MSASTPSPSDAPQSDVDAFLSIELIEPPSPSSSSSSSSSSSVVPTSTDYAASSSTPVRWYQSARAPRRMGNAGDMGYGGYTISIAVYSACVHVLPSTLPPEEGSPRFRIYSASGVFLRPSSTKSRFLTRVGLLRDTRTFKTCEVRVYQGDWNDLRLCMTATVDFMLATPTAIKGQSQDRSILQYSTQPSMDVTHYSQLQDDSETYASRSDLPPKGLQAFKEIFTPAHANMQSRSPPQSLWLQNAWGILKHKKTTQDSLPLVEKRGYDWMRAREKYNGYAKQAGALAWLMDAAISFAPLSYSHRFLDDAAAASTLSFNMAYHEEEIQLDEKWHLREIRTTDGRWERSTGEAKIWIEEEEEEGKQKGKGEMRCVATMTQSCVLKAKPAAPASKL
ncbi:hypothetical protein BCV69DRAFT_78460 [Microstroma glucosiphilum]|uniref:Thioesterase/thiol ester dehydrase-isomerase n=1 Tax=Pseudomicrostroma glucosiphilum TaxID=1684307 RepID=A0A316U018_9BASI|nr:hypothetical protein BCV69DRAFT_78460 [Pseudomicrostroma glucosiphilum]PWN18208.1 hypothetical protein BCV69DRAFT_78460 [Pseudomicrostroma glucosiphilum]